MKFSVKLNSHRSNGTMGTYQTKQSPFAADYRQACRILQAIRLYNGRPSQACLVHLATFVTKSWELDLSAEKVNGICEFINHLLDTTSLNCDSMSFDESIQSYCSEDVAIPTVCPGITLLFAIRYIERLNQNYVNVKGTKGSSRRLILVAYIIAAKYIHSNLKFIVATNLPPLKKKHSNTTTTSLPSQKPVTHPPDQASSRLGFRPGDLLSTALPISPPVSPKQSELTNPSQYHYFQSTETSNYDQCNSSSVHNTHIGNSSTGTNPMPSIYSMCSRFNYRVWRMENEFLHFLNGDIRVHDCLRLVDWANQVSPPSTN